MEFIVILLIATCIFLWIKNVQLNEKILHVRKSERIPTINAAKTKVETKPVKEVSKQSQEKKDINIEERVANESNSTPRTRRSSRTNHPTFNTGIAELDGPGVWKRLNQFENGHALYLLYSEEHNAYKVGKSKPDGIGHRINQIREDVPDVVLNGLAVFTSHQNAFDKETEILERYSTHQYLGINGRYTGRSEWITIRPRGRPNFPTPAKIEERFLESIEAPLQELDIPDNYTVYLLYSRSKNMYKCSWCNTENLPEKIKRSQRQEVKDAELISRIKVERRTKARAIAINNNEMSKSYRQEGRKQIYEWRKNPEYLYLFEDWDKEGQRR